MGNKGDSYVHCFPCLYKYLAKRPTHVQHDAMYVHTLRVCMHMRVLRTQEQLASATRSSCRNVMFAIVEYAWCTQHVGYISLPGIYMTVCISPFVALTISLIVYATENASAPLA